MEKDVKVYLETQEQIALRKVKEFEDNIEYVREVIAFSTDKDNFAEYRVEEILNYAERLSKYVARKAAEEERIEEIRHILSGL